MKIRYFVDQKYSGWAWRKIDNTIECMHENSKRESIGWQISCYATLEKLKAAQLAKREVTAEELALMIE